MNFTRTNVETCGTSLQGYVTAKYSDLVRVFGAPLEEVDGYKVSTEWDIKFADGTVATIYEYKETSLYDDANPSVADFRAEADRSDGFEWHVGGRDKTAVTHVIDALKSAPKPGMSSWTFGEEFEPNQYGLTRVISIASEGAVIAHVNCGFGNGREKAKLMAALPEMVEALRSIVRINGSTGGHKAMVEEFKFRASRALSKAGL
jgi:hypothetical protein